MIQDQKILLNYLNKFSGFKLNKEGGFTRIPKTDEHSSYYLFSKLEQQLEQRKAHKGIFNYCSNEIKDNNYYHTVFEVIKGLSYRIQQLSNLKEDGHNLINKAFLGQNPVLLFSKHLTNSEQSEQKGIANLIIGLFSAIRNPQAHEAQINWYLSEQDALDILTLVSFIHRKLDKVIFHQK